MFPEDALPLSVFIATAEGSTTKKKAQAQAQAQASGKQNGRRQDVLLLELSILGIVGVG